MKYLVFITLLMAGVAFAGGDKVRNASPILSPGDNACFYIAPPGVDEDKCSELPDQGQNSSNLVCNIEVVVFCPEGEDDDNEGQGNRR